MNIASLFIRRPIMTTLVMISILLFGLIAYRLLPVSDLPNVDYPTISVNASLPGANPDTMAAAVATPLEKEFSTISGVDSMSSSSTQGSTQITLQFSLSRNIDAAAQDVQAAIARSVRRLPDNMPNPPSYRKSNLSDVPIIMIALTSKDLPMSVLDQLGQTMMAQRISMINGVAQVQVFGSQKYAVRIELDPMALNARGIGISEVANAIREQNVNLPLGSLSGAHKSVTVQANGQILEASKFVSLIVAYRNGQPVRLGELGTVKDSVENDKQVAWYVTKDSMERSIVLAVQRQPGTNTVEVASAVKALLPSFKEKLPASVSLSVIRDSSVPIKESTNDVQFTLLLTLLLVVMVIFLFLRNFSATLIPSLTLPMSIIGTFAVMAILGYSLDNLSLMALTLSVGFVVDDAIVMLENIVRHMEMGKTRMQAAFDGAREIGFTIVSMTLSLAAVFIPVLFMGGIMGRLFREFSVTIGTAVLVSGLVSLTLTPMLASRFLRDARLTRHGVAYRVTEGAFQVMRNAYSWSLLKVLRHRLATVLISAAILIATIYLFFQMPRGLIPPEDRGMFQVRTEAAEDISYDAMVRHQMAVGDVIRADPDVDRFMSRSDAGNSGGMFVMLKPREERDVSVDQVIQRLRPKLAAIPGIRCILTNQPPIQTSGGRGGGRSLYQVTLQGTDIDQLNKYAAQFEREVGQLPQVQDVSSDMQLKNPRLSLEIDRDQAFILGITPMQIEDALYSAYGARQVSSILAPNDEYQVIMEVQEQYQTDPSVLSMLYVRSSSGQLVPIRALLTQKDDIAPLAVNHTGQLPSVTIAFNLTPGSSLGETMDRINEIARASMPSGMTLTAQGNVQVYTDFQGGMLWLLALTIVVIYIVLGILYESFVHPLTILTALPFAGFGALVTLLLFHAELSIYAFVGIIMLVGLVKKNGIMMVDFALQGQRSDGKSAHDAIHQACVVRFRPIMMTTMAALMAGLPIAMGFGAGGESRRPLGLAVVGGLLFSQTLTLFVTPVFYVYMEQLQVWLRRAVPQLQAWLGRVLSQLRAWLRRVLSRLQAGLRRIFAARAANE